MPEDLTLTFQYTEAEYVSAAHTYYARKFHVKTYLIVAGTILLAGLWLWWYSGEPVVLFGLSIFTLIIATPLIFYFVTPRAHFRREPALGQVYELRLAEDGLEFKTAHASSKTGWEFYKQLWETENFYFLFYGRERFTVIPKRAFVDKAQDTWFNELVRRKLTQDNSQ